MKGIKGCEGCAHYSRYKQKCRKGCTGERTGQFYPDCPLPDVQPVERPPKATRKINPNVRPRSVFLEKEIK